MGRERAESTQPQRKARGLIRPAMRALAGAAMLATPVSAVPATHAAAVPAVRYSEAMAADPAFGEVSAFAAPTADESHEFVRFVVTPNAGLAGVAASVRAEGFCHVDSAVCDKATGTSTGVLSFAPCGASGTPGRPAGCDGTVEPIPDASQAICPGTALDNSTAMRVRDGNLQVVSGTGTMPASLSPDRYVICHFYRPNVMYDVFTVTAV